MMLFAAVARATWQKAWNNFDNYHTPFLVEAANFDEAVGKATRIMDVIYPPNSGWKDRYAYVSGLTLTPETAAPSVLPEVPR